MILYPLTDSNQHSPWDNQAAGEGCRVGIHMYVK